MRVAVIGHIEHVEFLRVTKVPAVGEIAHAKEYWDDAAGGGGVAAVQLAKLAGSCTLFTALGDDAVGRAVPERLAKYGVRTLAGWRNAPQRRGVVFIDDNAERTITVIGARHQPELRDELPWVEFASFDAVYFTAGEPEVLRMARSARVVVATARVLPILEEAGIELDAIVRSAHDAGEPDPATRNVKAKLVAATEGANGGLYVEGEQRGRWSAHPLPGPPVDAYGCGDSFAAGLTYALGARMNSEDALAFAAKCGAHSLTGRGPFGGQLELGADDRK